MPTANDLKWLLILNAPAIVALSFALTFAVCLAALRRDSQKLYRAAILSVAVPQLLFIGPACAILTWLSLADLPVVRRTIMSAAFSLFAFPQSLALAALCCVVLVRHRRSETAAYWVEAIAALAIAALGAYWTHELFTGDWH